VLLRVQHDHRGQRWAAAVPVSCRQSAAPAPLRPVGQAGLQRRHGSAGHHPGQEYRQTRRIRRFRYEAYEQECPDWFKIPRDLDPASAKWQMFLIGPGATIRA